MRIEKLQKDFEIETKWRCFPLHPEVPEEGITLARLFNTAPMNVESYGKDLKKTASELGLPFGERFKTYNTRLSQELGLWAESLNKGDPFHMAVFKAYFVNGKNIAKKDVLFDLAESAGLLRGDAESILEGRTFKDAVDRDWADARRMNITAVPTTMIHGKRLVGFQPYEKLARLVRDELVQVSRY